MPGTTAEIDLERRLGWAILARGRASRALVRLLQANGGAEGVLAMSLAEASARSEEPNDVVAPLLRPESASGIPDQIRRLEATGTRVLLFTDAEYPSLLRHLPDPPAVLFARGGAFREGPAVGIVGARRATRAGRDVARKIAEDLTRAGVLVVSGFARGIDAASHRGALDAGGPTVGVLGCGVDVCYPPEQEELFADTLESGTFLSEFPMGTQPLPQFFPLRNRIIAGLSRIVLVVEAAERSGSLITARCALDYGREVAAVPGSVLSSVSAGTNALLKDGAILVRSAEDLLSEMSDLFPRKRRAKTALGGADVEALLASLDAEAKAVFAALDPDEPRDADALVAASSLPAPRVFSALVVLELEGLATALPGAVFVRKR